MAAGQTTSVLSPGSLASEPDPVNLAAQLQFPLLGKKKKKVYACCCNDHDSLQNHIKGIFFPFNQTTVMKII